MRLNTLKATCIILGFSGCASVNTVSQLDPRILPPHYPRILVVANTSDLALQQEVELAFLRVAEGKGMNIIPYHQIFLPGRDYDPEVVRAEMEVRGIQGMLVLRDLSWPRKSGHLVRQHG